MPTKGAFIITYTNEVGRNAVIKNSVDRTGLRATTTRNENTTIKYALAVNRPLFKPTSDIKGFLRHGLQGGVAIVRG